MENFSENKGKGRPKCAARHMIEFIPSNAMPHPGHCLRSKINFGYQAIFINEVKDPDAQKTIWGVTKAEVRAGKFCAKGWHCAAEAAGRWIQAGNGPQEAVEIMADARRREISFTEIAAHFRALRLGKQKEGDLLLAIAQTIDRYRKQFPETTAEQERAALSTLFEYLGRE